MLPSPADDLFLHAELRIGVPQVIIRNRAGVVMLRFIGTSTKDALRKGLQLIDHALEEAKKPKEDL